MSVLAAALAALLAAAAPPPASAPPVARVDGQPVTADELERRAAARTIEARTRVFEQQREALDELIEARLLEAEARRRGIGVEALLQDEVERRLVPPTELDARRALEARPDFKGLRGEGELARALARLREERRLQRRFGFVATLRAGGRVQVLLEPPRVEVAEDGAASRGPAGAPVTIVEFSDFQCPFCRRVTPTIAALEARYGARLRRVFRHYPLDRHPEAPLAAEAAECAREQGRFWEMHDRLFDGQDALKRDDLRQHARAIGLDGAGFDGCLASGRHAARWRRDREAAEAYAPSGTPLFFVNGRLVVGAQPYAVFARVIDEELARAAGRSNGTRGTAMPPPASDRP